MRLALTRITCGAGIPSSREIERLFLVRKGFHFFGLDLSLLLLLASEEPPCSESDGSEKDDNDRHRDSRNYRCALLIGGSLAVLLLLVELALDSGLADETDTVDVGRAYETESEKGLGGEQVAHLWY